MFMFENEITIEDRELLEEYLGSFEYSTSGLSFTSLYMWRNINHFSWQVIGEYLCIAGISHLELDKQEAFLFPPLTKTGTYDKAQLQNTILEAKKIFESKNQKFSVRLLPKHMIEILEWAFPGQLSFAEDRPNFDYVYKIKDLIKLSGRKYHSKRNHLNFFTRNFEYIYKPIDSSMVEEALDFIRQFNENKHLSEYEENLLKMEEEAMVDVFRNLDKVGYISGAILIDGKIQALTIGGALDHKTVTVHVEKANVEYRGSYQAINNEFCKHLPREIKYINREEDMDLPGLREAKLSYRPIRMIEKYIACFRDI